MRPSTIALQASLASVALATPPSYGHHGNPTVKKTSCNGEKYVYEELAGYGFLPSNGRDKTGDTLGGIGSSLAIDKNSWQKEEDGRYKGIMYALPDRGWNTNGTLNYQNRVHKIGFTLTPQPEATVENPAKPNLEMKYIDSILFTDPSGEPTTGLDPDILGPYKHFPGYPFGFPSVHYPGNGFGQGGPGGFRVSFDSEGLVLAPDGSFWASDEYADYMYHFSQSGKMIGAIRPPPAFIPRRNGSVSFSADGPPIYNPDLAPVPENNPIGRNNNQGLEGLTSNPEATKLYALTQSALNQDGGLDGVERYSHLLVYDISTTPPTYEAEYVVRLPLVDPNDEDSDVARQSEIHYVSETQFLILPRDSDAGAGQDDTKSKYRHVDIFDISAATDVKGRAADCPSCAIANGDGELHDDVVPAEFCSWLDFNINSQLERFGVHNGGAQDKGLLNEKWESLALLPVNPGKEDGEYFLFSLSDNDFITQDGAMNGGKLKYSDESGFELLNQALVFKVKLPKKSLSSKHGLQRQQATVSKFLRSDRLTQMEKAKEIIERRSLAPELLHRPGHKQMCLRQFILTIVHEVKAMTIMEVCPNDETAQETPSQANQYTSMWPPNELPKPLGPRPRPCPPRPKPRPEPNKPPRPKPRADTSEPTEIPAPQRKRVSFDADQPTGCPPKKVRFTSDTKPGSQGKKSGESMSSDKTRWPAPGLSSVKRDFKSRKPVPTSPPIVENEDGELRADAQVSIPAKGKSYRGTPKVRDQKKGFEWISYEIKVTASGKRWQGK